MLHLVCGINYLFLSVNLILFQYVNLLIHLFLRLPHIFSLLVRDFSRL